ncbi:MAG: OmpA family protein, partial [Armatimonadia bacterium]|nr:OmpA family protein [Armatimonadia bacterium]
MPIQAPKQEGGGGEAWLATYGDMVTLLLTFFVMMYALLTNASTATTEETTQARIEFFQQLQQGMSRASMMPDSSPVMRPLPQTGQDLLNRQYVDFVATQTVNADIETFEDRIRITLPGDVLFLSGEASIREAAYEDLNSIADALVQYPGLVYVSGHTDSDPFDPDNESPYGDNWGLSAARAANVVRYLEDQGVPRADLRAVACADTVPRPAGARRGEAYKAYQRRVELTVIPGGDPFGGGYAELGQD